MSSPTITYRQLINGDPARGNGQLNFLTNLQAVEQAIYTSLNLFTGSWWENLKVGLPLFQSILGQVNTTNGVGLLVRQVILGVPYVTGVQNMVVIYSGNSRQYTFSCTVTTQFGTTQINTQPLPGLQAV